MAKQLSGFIEGCFDGIQFYKMQEHYYARVKSSLSGERFWKDAAFKGSRKSSQRFAEGNQLASAIYKSINEEKRTYPVFLFLKKAAIRLLKEGKSPEAARLMLEAYLIDFKLLKVKDEKTVTEDTGALAYGLPLFI